MEAPTNPRWASSRAESTRTLWLMAVSMAAVAALEFAQLRSTAVAKISTRAQLRLSASFSRSLSTVTARAMPALERAPSVT